MPHATPTSENHAARPAERRRRLNRALSLAGVVGEQLPLRTLRQRDVEVVVGKELLVIVPLGQRERELRCGHTTLILQRRLAWSVYHAAQAGNARTEKTKHQALDPLTGARAEVEQRDRLWREDDAGRSMGSRCVTMNGSEPAAEIAFQTKTDRFCQHTAS